MKCQNVQEQGCHLGRGEGGKPLIESCLPLKNTCLQQSKFVCGIWLAECRTISNQNCPSACTATKQQTEKFLQITMLRTRSYLHFMFCIGPNMCIGTKQINSTELNMLYNHLSL